MRLVHGFYGMYTQTGVTVHFAAPHKETRPGGKTVIVPPKESEGCRVQDSDRLHLCNSGEYDIIVV